MSSPFANTASKPRILRQVRQDARLDLAIVGAEQGMAWRRNEGFADAQAIVALHRNILQIRLGGGEPSGRRDGLIERRMEPLGLRIHQLGQRIHIGGLEFAEAPIVHDLRGQFVLGSQLRQRVFIRRVAGLGFPDRLESQLFEQHRGELLRRIDVELAAGYHGNGLHDLVEIPLQFFAQRVQALDIQQEPVPLDLGQHRHQRHFHVGEEREASLFRESFRHGLGKLGQHRRGLRCLLARPCILGIEQGLSGAAFCLFPAPSRCPSISKAMVSSW